MMNPICRVLGFIVLGFLSGCDFWQNLIAEKAITKNTLTIVVQDAWTRKPIPEAVCKDDAKGLTLITGLDGIATAVDMSTGPYSLKCQGNAYHEVDWILNLAQIQRLDTVTLVRRGGKDTWYPRDPEREIDFYFGDGNLRVPGFQKFQSTVTDTTGIFRYKWTSAKHPEMNRDWTSLLVMKNYVQANLQSLDSEIEEDFITLTVRAKFPGHREYDIDSIQNRVVWRRNNPPSLKVLNATRPVAQVGCKTSQDQEVMVVKYIAEDKGEDEGGQNCKVTIESLDLTSSTGRFKKEKDCQGEDYESIPLNNIFSDIKSSEILKNSSRKNSIKITVKDFNGQSVDTTIFITTQPHIPPEISISKVNTPPIVYEGKTVTLKVRSQSFGSSLGLLKLSWGDGTRQSFSMPDFPPVDNIEEMRSHQYENAAAYTIAATIIDACNDTSTITLPTPIIITKNSNPEIIKDSLVTDFNDLGIRRLNLQFKVKDSDLETGTDSLTLLVDWGDSKMETRKINKDSSLTFSYQHLYTNPPVDTLNKKYYLKIKVQDANEGEKIKKYEIPGKP